tara:strand:+ start:591 stop:1049 length:459 start_codon:yes stop_codon:yes gene_type:complete
MKIYTEINYEWLDGQLVKTSSKSFEYSGNISECKGGGGDGGLTASVIDQTTDFVDRNTDSVANSSEIQQLGEHAQTAFDIMVNPLKIPQMLWEQFGPKPPEEEEVVTAATEPSYAKGVDGKAIKNNPFLAIKKGEKFARSSSQFRRPTNTLS